MSALLIDLPLADLPTPARGRRWMHVVPDPAPAVEVTGAVRPLPHAEPTAPLARTARPARTLPQVRPVPTRTAAAPAPLRLTRRGLAVVVGGFSLLMMTALVVLVVGFLAVSNEPIVASLPLN